MLHHVGMSWIIISKKETDYDNFTNSKNLGWFDIGPWHNKNICLNYMELFLKVLLHRLEQTDTISCVLYLLMIGCKIINKMMKAFSAIEKYQKMQQ